MLPILCLGSESDPQLQHLNAALRDAGAETLTVDTARFPTDLQITAEPGFNRLALCVNDELFNIEEFGAFLWQRYFPPQHRKGVDSKNAISALSPLFYHQPERWFNSLCAIRFHQAKPVQLQEARRLGAIIPKTLISNDRQRLRQFCTHQGDVIIKPVFGGTHTVLINQHDALLQTPVGEKRLPVTFQEYIEGDDVRTFVIGNRVFAAAIYSDQTDYRTDDSAYAEAIVIPHEIEALAIAICLQFGMKWCAIDWRRNSKGEFVFLEANPAPMFCRFEAETGLPITETLVLALTDNH